jgi:hypothetical protein
MLVWFGEGSTVTVPTPLAARLAAAVKHEPQSSLKVSHYREYEQNSPALSGNTSRLRHVRHQQRACHALSLRLSQNLRLLIN